MVFGLLPSLEVEQLELALCTVVTTSAWPASLTSCHLLTPLLLSKASYPCS